MTACPSACTAAQSFVKHGHLYAYCTVMHLALKLLYFVARLSIDNIEPFAWRALAFLSLFLCERRCSESPREAAGARL